MQYSRRLPCGDWKAACACEQLTQPLFKYATSITQYAVNLDPNAKIETSRLVQTLCSYFDAKILAHCIVERLVKY